MAEKYYTLSEEAIQKLCGLVRESHSVADAIDDSGALSEKSTFSNKKINDLLTEIETSISDVSDKVDNLEFIDDTLVSTDKAFSSQKTTSLINNPYEYVFDSSIYGADILKYTLGHYKIGNNSTISEFTNLPVNIPGMLDVMCPANGGNQSPWESQYGYRYYRYTTYRGGTYERTLASGATAGNITEDTGWKKIAYNGESLSLNGLELSSGARISINGSASGVGTLIDGEYFTIDNANTGKSSTITANGIDTQSIVMDDSENDLKTTITAGNIDLTASGMGGTVKSNDVCVSWITGLNGKTTDDIDFGSNILANQNVYVSGDLKVGGKDVIHTGNVSDYAGMSMTLLAQNVATGSSVVLSDDLSNYKTFLVEGLGMVSGSTNYVVIASQTFSYDTFSRHTGSLILYSDLGGSIKSANVSYESSTKTIRVDAMSGTGITASGYRVWGIK